MNHVFVNECVIPGNLRCFCEKSDIFLPLNGARRAARAPILPFAKYKWITFLLWSRLIFELQSSRSGKSPSLIEFYVKPNELLTFRKWPNTPNGAARRAPRELQLGS